MGIPFSKRDRKDRKDRTPANDFGIVGSYGLDDVAKAVEGDPESFDPHAVKQAPIGEKLEPFVAADVLPAVNESDEAEVPTYASLRDSADAIETPVEGDHYKLLRKVDHLPTPYDKNAPVHGVLEDSHEPSRWSPICDDVKLEDRAAGHEVRCGDHVAYFDPKDAALVDGLWALLSVPTKPSSKKVALIRLRTTLAVLKGTPLSKVFYLEKVARLFHDALEHAPGESIATADLEACLASWVNEPTRYAPFPDLEGAVGFMHLPVRDGKVSGMALKHRFDSAPDPPPATHHPTVPIRTNVTSKNLNLVSEPKVEFKRVSPWYEPPRATRDDNAAGKPFTINGSSHATKDLVSEEPEDLASEVPKDLASEESEDLASEEPKEGV